MKSRVIFLLVLSLFCGTVHAQDAGRETMLKLLSKEWLLQKTETGGHSILPSNALPRFRLVLHDNGTCEQGIPPEGMIVSHWTLSDDFKHITFDDPQIKQKYTATIVVINTTQLILTMDDNGHLTTMYYSLE